MTCEARRNKCDIKSHRPITVASVEYKVAMQIVKRMETWVEGEEALGELQNGFRRGRRIEGILLVATQCIEIVEKLD